MMQASRKYCVCKPAGTIPVETFKISLCQPQQVPEDGASSLERSAGRYSQTASSFAVSRSSRRFCVSPTLFRLVSGALQNYLRFSVATGGEEKREVCGVTQSRRYLIRSEIATHGWE